MTRPRFRRPALVALVALGILGAAVGATFAAFSSQSNNSGDLVDAGSVTIADNDGGSAMLTLATAQPGATDTGCIKVTYGGSLGSTVRLYGTTGGTGLDPYLDLRVTRGINTPTDPAFDSCANFQADGTDYLGAGAGVVYEGSVQGYADNYAAGQVDPTAGSPETWTNAESHVYKIEVTQRFNTAGNGLNATQAFTWEARNQ